jgi:hypothetical protein
MATTRRGIGSTTLRIWIWRCLEDAGGIDDERAADREQELVDCPGENRGLRERLVGARGREREDSPAEDYPAGNAKRDVRSDGAQGPPADPAEADAEQAVLGGLDAGEDERRDPEELAPAIWSASPAPR